ncbi:ankyrin repeat and LEM domain-containing protein 1 [Ctenodactylus gundi]
MVAPPAPPPPRAAASPSQTAIIVLAPVPRPGAYRPPQPRPAAFSGVGERRDPEPEAAMWTRARRGYPRLGAETGGPGPRGGTARAQEAAAGNWKQGLVAARGPDGNMGPADGLEERLRAAVQAQRPRAVEQLLSRGADPNLLLDDGAAAVHLAAGTRRPRGLCCLGALLRRGGDPNARSAEALTPLHVAAAWGCRRGLELLLRQGADPTLRDQDGLRALDLAEQHGHRECVRILRGLDTPSLERHPSSSGLSRSSAVTRVSSTTCIPPGRLDCRDMGLEAGLGPPRTPAHLETVQEPRDSASPVRGEDCSTDATFVTAVEASGGEDTASDRNWQPGAQPMPVTPESVLGEVGLSALLQTMTLGPSPSEPHDFSPLPDTSPVSPNSHCPADGPTSLVSDMAALWLTEDEAGFMRDRNPIPSCLSPLIPPKSGPAPFLMVPELGGSCCRVTHPIVSRSCLHEPEEVQATPDFSKHSPELAKALRTGCIPDSQADEDALAQEFEHLDPKKKWREGIVKASFTYLLLDPRQTQDLPARASSLTLTTCLQTFAHAIFYVGKGTRSRPHAHLWEALSYYRRPRKQARPKVRQILDIWDSGRGVISLHCFQHMVAVEAYTREACLVDALGIQTLTNQKQGHYYGAAAGWSPARRRRLGVHLLRRALLIFLAEGARELRPEDIQAT